MRYVKMYNSALKRVYWIPADVESKITEHTTWRQVADLSYFILSDDNLVLKNRCSNMEEVIDSAMEAL